MAQTPRLTQSPCAYDQNRNLSLSALAPEWGGGGVLKAQNKIRVEILHYGSQTSKGMDEKQVSSISTA